MHKFIWYIGATVLFILMTSFFFMLGLAWGFVLKPWPNLCTLMTMLTWIVPSGMIPFFLPSYRDYHD